jgi:glycosyltransferase involved in cell wall biosynthesis
MKNSKVLYLTHDGLTDPLGQSQILPYVTGLSKNGISFTIISFEKKDRFIEQSHAISSLCHQHKINWIPLQYHNSPPVLSTLFDIWRLRTTAEAVFRRNSFDFVHCRSYITSLTGLSLKRKFKVKFIFDMRGFWADERVEGGLWNRKNPVYNSIYNFFKRKERQFFTEADAIVSLTHNAKEYITTHVGIKPELITVIPCSVDLNLFKPESIQQNETLALRKQLGFTSEDFVLLYLGSLGTWYLYDEMVRVFDDLKQTMPRSKFLFLTPDIKKVSERPDFKVLSVPRNQVPLYCSIADASIVFIKPSFSKKASSATKMAEVMAMGLPVITNAGWGDVDHFISHGARIIIHAQDTPIKLNEFEAFSDNAEFVKRYMSLSAAVDLYAEIYERLEA